MFRKVIRSICRHPLSRREKMRAFGRFVRWQISSRLADGAFLMPFVNDSRLIVRRGMKGATGNIYNGLHDYEEMSFVLHLLRPDDMFVDVGANVGTYTVLAAKAAGARCISFEPGPVAYEGLLDNLNVNRVTDRVEALNSATGAEESRLRFLVDCDAVNRIALPEDESSGRSVVDVSVKRLDDVLADRDPTLIKIDVEGFETQVIEGAQRVLERPSLLAIIMETNESGNRYGFDEGALERRLNDAGYRACDYQPHTRELVPLEKDEPRAMNTILVRSAELENVRVRLREAPAFRVLNHSI